MTRDIKITIKELSAGIEVKMVESCLRTVTGVKKDFIGLRYFRKLAVEVMVWVVKICFV
jgi:hypothetical protein